MWAVMGIGDSEVTTGFLNSGLFFSEVFFLSGDFR